MRQSVFVAANVQFVYADERRRVRVHVHAFDVRGEEKKRYTIRVRLCVMLYPHACMMNVSGATEAWMVVWLLMCLR